MTLGLPACFAYLAAWGCSEGLAGGTLPAPPAGCTRDPQGIGFDASVTGATLPDFFTPAAPPRIGPPPPCTGVWLTGQRLDLSAWGTAFPGGVDKRAGACVPAGTWTGKLSLGVARPDGSCTHGPTSAGVSVSFSLTYGGDFDRRDPAAPPEACLFRSGLTFVRFTVTGCPTLDAAIEAHVRDDIHAQVDRAIADQVNQRLPMPDVTSGQPLPTSSDGRCSDWKQADLPLP